MKEDGENRLQVKDGCTPDRLPVSILTSSFSSFLFFLLCLYGGPLPRTSVGMYPPLNRSRWAAAGSLTAQYGSSINQRHFQCPITETLLLGLSAADSSPIHLLAGGKKAIVARQPPLPVQTEAVKSAGRPL